jgi:PAS domain S-box-containing protein
LAAPVRNYAVYTLNHQGLVSGWSAGATRMLGFSADEILGAHFSRFFVESERIAGKPEQLLRLASASGSADYVGQCVSKNGSYFESHISTSALRDNNAVLLGFASIVRDLTFKVASDDGKALETSLVPAVHQAVVVCDLNGRITFWSESAQTLYQWTSAEAVGRTSHELFRASSPIPLDKIGKSAMQSTTWDGRLVHHRRDGSAIVVESHWELQRDDRGVAFAILELDREVAQELAADQTLSETPRLLSEEFERAVIGMGLVALDGRWIRVNPALATMLGYTPGELIGSDSSYVTRLSDANISETERRALVDGKTEFQQTEVHFVRQNGETLWGLVTLSLMRDALGRPLHFLVQIQDLTERKNAVQSLADQRNLLEAIVENMGHALFVVDPSGVVLFFNRTARNLFGNPGFVPPEKWPEAYGLYGADQHTYFNHRDLPLWQTLNGESLAEGEMWVRNEITPNGAWIQAVSRSLLNQDGSLHGAIVVARDVTSQKKMEMEMEWNRAQTASSARLSALGMMAGSIAHEINNPLAILHAGATNLMEMAEMGEAPPSIVAANSARLVHTAERIAKIITSLRHISREGDSDAFVNIPIYQIVGHALDLWQERFKARSITLDYRPYDRLLTVRCREVQIAQIVLNLLQNAFDAVETLESKRMITIQVTTAPPWLDLSVLDNGPGFSPESKRLAMNPFFTTKPVGKGTGLGLSISNAIAVEHGGKLEISEREGQTCVSLLLPLNTKS